MGGSAGGDCRTKAAGEFSHFLFRLVECKVTLHCLVFSLELGKGLPFFKFVK